MVKVQLAQAAHWLRAKTCADIYWLSSDTKAA